MTKCMICCMELGSIKSLAQHISRKHDMTSEEYYTQYISQQPKCKMCDNFTKFKSLSRGFNTFCSKECAGADPAVVEARKKSFVSTCQERYGTDNVMQASSAKAKFAENFKAKHNGLTNPLQDKDIRSKQQSTMNTRYGVSFPMLSADLKERHSASCKKSLGVSSPMQNGSVRAKAVSTFNRKYGVDNPYLIPTVRETGKQASRAKAEVSLEKLFGNGPCKFHGFDSTGKNVVLYCCSCKSEITVDYYLARTRAVRGQSPCTKCFPINAQVSQEEIGFAEQIKSLLPDTEVITSDRVLIGPKELDVYIPSLGLAFEYDGLYFHSEARLDDPRNYHLSKTLRCKEKGVQLVHVFSDEWINKQSIVISRIKSMLGKCNRIYARKCVLKIVASDEARAFLNANHLQGFCRSTVAYGLFYNEELVAIMTFGPSRFKPGEYELLRYCSKQCSSVIGGASKLFKHFLRNNVKIRSIVSYADRRWSNGGLYRSLGFNEETASKPSYSYFKDSSDNPIRENRMKYQKKKLEAMFGAQDKSEHEIMLEHGYLRIYDCGNMRFVFSVQ